MENKKTKTVYKKLLEAQTQLVAHKNQFNKFGGYKYRSCEDIMSGIKKLEKEIGFVVVITDNIHTAMERFYVQAVAKFIDIDNGDEISSCAYARECLDKKGMDHAQITGAASSYARKYALSALFAIDDGQDSDSMSKPESQKETVKKEVLSPKVRARKGMDILGFEEKEKRTLVVAFKDGALLDRLTQVSQGKLTKEKLMKEAEGVLNAAEK